MSYRAISYLSSCHSFLLVVSYRNFLNNALYAYVIRESWCPELHNYRSFALPVHTHHEHVTIIYEQVGTRQVVHEDDTS